MGMGIDWGETSPACVEVGARDEDNRIYFVDELYCPGQTGTILGGKMLEMFASQEWSRAKKWRPDEVPGYIDPSAHRVHSKGDSMNISDAIESCGFSTFPANNDRIPGWRHIAERMNPQKNKDGTFGKPRVFVFKDRCPRLCEQLSRAVPDPQRPGDINTRIEDHALDAARYLAQEWPLDLYASYEDDDEDLRAWAQVAAWKSRVSGNIPSTGYGD